MTTRPTAQKADAASVSGVQQQYVRHKVRRSAFALILMIVTLVKATGIEALRATTFVVMLPATSLAAIVTTFLAPTVAPDRVSHDVKSFRGCNRVIARDDQLATSRTLFSRLVPNQDTQTRAGV